MIYDGNIAQVVNTETNHTPSCCFRQKGQIEIRFINLMFSNLNVSDIGMQECLVWDTKS